MSEGRPKIRWARGFFRAWVVIFIIWSIPAAYINYDWSYERKDFSVKIGEKEYKTNRDFYNEDFLNQQREIDALINDKAKDPGDWPRSSDRNNWHIEHGPFLFRTLIPPFCWALIPPIILLVFGAMIGWAISGFKRA